MYVLYLLSVGLVQAKLKNYTFGFGFSYLILVRFGPAKPRPPQLVHNTTLDFWIGCTSYGRV